MTDRGMRHAVSWQLVLVCVSFAVAALVSSRPAHAYADPDYWKQTQERRQTVYRLLYHESPQAIPIEYNPVSEAESILRQRERQLAVQNPKAPSLWKQIRTVTVRSALSTPLRAAGTISLGIGVFYGGWKLGEGINAKFLKIGLYEPPPAPPGPITYRLRWHSSVNRWRFENNYGRATWYPGYYYQRHNDCDPYGIQGAPEGMDEVVTQTGIACSVNGPSLTSNIVEYRAPEDFLPQRAPIEDYTGQPYDKALPAPPAPSRISVEQAIDAELAKPENSTLRDWLNYQLGSLDQENPLEGSVPECAGVSVATCRSRLDAAGFTHTTTTELATPDYSKDPLAVVRTQPSAGARRDLGDTIEIVHNPAAPYAADASDRDHEDCDHTPRTTLPDGDPWEIVDEFYAHDRADPVPLYRGTNWFGRRHIAFKHGWGAFERANVSAALTAPDAAELGGPNPVRQAEDGTFIYYFPWVAANGHTHCTTVVVVDPNLDPNAPTTPPKSIITSYAYVGWYKKYG